MLAGTGGRMEAASLRNKCNQRIAVHFLVLQW